MDAAGMKGSGFSLFTQSIPFQFFSFTSIAIALISTVPSFNIGKMKALVKKTSTNPMAEMGGPHHQMEFANEKENMDKDETAKDQMGTASKGSKMAMSMDHDDMKMDMSGQNLC